VEVGQVEFALAPVGGGKRAVHGCPQVFGVQDPLLELAADADQWHRGQERTTVERCLTLQ
jgi:hypothetical protein